MSRWEINAMFAHKEYGSYVDLDECYYICPFCGEPVYKDDWNEEELNKYLCPICEDEDEDEG